jgi:hypothetical protein
MVLNKIEANIRPRDILENRAGLSVSGWVSWAKMVQNELIVYNYSAACVTKKKDR